MNIKDCLLYEVHLKLNRLTKFNKNKIYHINKYFLQDIYFKIDALRTPLIPHSESLKSHHIKIHNKRKLNKNINKQSSYTENHALASIAMCN